MGKVEYAEYKFSGIHSDSGKTVCQLKNKPAQLCEVNVPLKDLKDLKPGSLKGEMTPNDGYIDGETGKTSLSFGEKPEIIYASMNKYKVLPDGKVKIQALVKSEGNPKVLLKMEKNGEHVKELQLEPSKDNPDLYKHIVDIHKLKDEGYVESLKGEYALFIEAGEKKVRIGKEYLTITSKDNERPVITNISIEPKTLTLAKYSDKGVKIKVEINDTMSGVNKNKIKAEIKDPIGEIAGLSLKPQTVDSKGNGIYIGNYTNPFKKGRFPNNRFGIYSVKLEFEDKVRNSDEKYTGSFFVYNKSKEIIKPLFNKEATGYKGGRYNGSNNNYTNKIDLVFFPSEYGREEQTIGSRTGPEGNKFERAVRKNLDWFLERINEKGNPREHFNYWYVDTYSDNICGNNICDYELIKEITSLSNKSKDQIVVFRDIESEAISSNPIIVSGITVGIAFAGYVIYAPVIAMSLAFYVDIPNLERTTITNFDPSDHPVPINDIIMIHEPHAYSRPQLAHTLGHSLFELSDSTDIDKENFPIHKTLDKYPNIFMSKTECETHVRKMWTRGKLDKLNRCEEFDDSGWYRIKQDSRRIMGTWDEVGVFDPLAKLRIQYVLNNIPEFFG